MCNGTALDVGQYIRHAALFGVSVSFCLRGRSLLWKDPTVGLFGVDRTLVLQRLSRCFSITALYARSQIMTSEDEGNEMMMSNIICFGDVKKVLNS